VDWVRRWPWYVVPLGIFLAMRAVDAGLVVVVARDQISSSLLPPGLTVPSLVDPPSYLHVIANWDGHWYRLIAAHGYPAHLPVLHGVVQQNAWAFYPLYPGLVRLVMVSGASFGWAASVVSIGCAAAAMCVLFRMLEPACDRFTASLTVLAVSCAPAAPIFQAAYTEGVALLLLVVSLWALERRRYPVLLAAGLALSLTRAIVAPLALVVVVQAVVRWRRRDDDPFPVRERWMLGAGALAIALSSLIWPAVTAVATGDARAYWRTQTAWATVAGNRPDTWLQSLTRLDNAGRLVVVLVALALLVLVCRRAGSWPLPLRTWPVAYAVFILAVTPPTASVIRFSTLALAPWWPAPELSRGVRSTAGRVALVALVVGVGVLLQWWWLRSYFVIQPSSVGHP
jgi:hypothetical protein